MSKQSVQDCLGSRLDERRWRGWGDHSPCDGVCCLCSRLISAQQSPAFAFFFHASVLSESDYTCLSLWVLSFFVSLQKYVYLPCDCFHGCLVLRGMPWWPCCIPPYSNFPSSCSLPPSPNPPQFLKPSLCSLAQDPSCCLTTVQLLKCLHPLIAAFCHFLWPRDRELSSLLCHPAFTVVLSQLPLLTIAVAFLPQYYVSSLFHFD